MTAYDLSPSDVPLVFTQGDDVSVGPLYVSGNRAAYTFAAKLKPAIAANGTTTTSFAVTVGSYDAGLGETPVTVVLTDTQTDLLTLVGRTPGYFWDLQWTDGGGLLRTVASGLVTVLEDVT